MSGNGVMTGICIVITAQVQILIQPDLIVDLSTWHVAVAGVTMPLAVELLIVISAIPVLAITT